MTEEVSKEIELTDLPGIGEATAKKLISAGYVDLMSIAVLAPRELSQLAEVTESTARKTILAARHSLDLGFQDASKYLEKRKEILRLTTGSDNLNSLLGGGVETKSITEAFGAFGSGKTQLAHCIACTVQLPIEKGGAEGYAVYIDTEGTFRPERIKQIAKNHGLNPEEALKKIFPVVQVKEKAVKKLLTGKPILKEDSDEELKERFVAFCDDKFIGVYKKVGEIAKAEFVYQEMKG